MGPVFGPLVISGAAVEEAALENLLSIGVKDSKKFGSGPRAIKQRLEVLEISEEYILDSFSVVIEPEEIRAGNLYTLHIGAVQSILHKLSWRESTGVYIDRLGGMNRAKFLQNLGFWHSNFIYEKEADRKYPQVSLASLKAKNERDRIVAGLCEEMGEEYISGYANSATEGLLRRYFQRCGKLPPGTRRSYAWAPIVEMISAGG